MYIYIYRKDLGASRRSCSTSLALDDANENLSTPEVGIFHSASTIENCSALSPLGRSRR